MSWFSGRKRIINFLLPLILALVFFSLSSPRIHSGSWYESAFLNLLSPFQYAVNSASDFFGSTWDGYISLVHVKEENEMLKKELVALKGDLVILHEAKVENERLRSLLDYKEALSYPVLVAKVISNDPRSEFKSVTIDCGATSGIEPLMPVMGAEGLVGRVGKVSLTSSKVLLITDPNSAVDVFDQRSRARALLVGVARRSIFKAANYYISRLEYLMRTSDIKEGDVVVTSGFDHLYPAGLPVGTIHNISQSEYGVFQEADILPYENLSELEEVMVILKPAEEFEEESP